MNTNENENFDGCRKHCREKAVSEIHCSIMLSATILNVSGATV